MKNEKDRKIEVSNLKILEDTSNNLISYEFC